MYRISFQQIEYFLTVAKCLNFTDAAQQLYISQPALSKQISLLEKELGILLFTRNKRHVALTPAGEALVTKWDKLKEDLDASIYQAHLIEQQESGTLRIGCINSFHMNNVLPALLQTFTNAYPQIELTIESYSYKALREKFQNNSIDVMVTMFFDLEGLENIEWMKLKDVPLGIAVPASNPLCQKEDFQVSDLRNETFLLISPKESPGGVERTCSFCEKYGFQPVHFKYLPNATSLELAITNGLGVAVCERALVSGNANIKLFSAEFPDDSFLTGVWKKNRENIALNYFKKSLQDSLIQSHER